MNLSEFFWDNKYLNNKIGWDLGEISPPLKMYFDQLKNKELKILIPGGGNSYEAEYLFNNGFKNIFVVDLSKTALENIKKRVPDFPKDQLILGDFFDLNITFDLVIEQTFFCALNPNLRPNYAEKMNDLLTEKGKLVGLLFDAKLNEDHPPFGGNKKEYITYFKPYFRFNVLEKCYNSYHNRQAMELFMIFQKL
ncbi:methyltransferase domain-containing protein [Tenacibaculum piscium]|uniref:SAM-dependent methyltransferase n=1 Tax=Tenacibaculum piscium TaxID=1458515 RepID=A0A2H1YI79_9FLAO|nr:methyltransferase domain-containing protein [Tenacibaculum piscium]MBE7629788.1 methyltransferase domain-containing protein [Tenacibaculum piscium]MBE7670200.1 methyltransferase domain-containing protein [Tenacibaculum piscium]MBE7686357.1 methyltransferase domain-containing protein [Tenacibaculum piscium]MBE7691064.1 methyltransferase domain-containing protein [Tenacibaculum piscium]SOS75202.1 SAM-dependent methyltransferase [Tenacibaculum piscium]